MAFEPKSWVCEQLKCTVWVMSFFLPKSHDERLDWILTFAFISYDQVIDSFGAILICRDVHQKRWYRDNSSFFPWILKLNVGWTIFLLHIYSRGLVIVKSCLPPLELCLITCSFIGKAWPRIRLYWYHSLLLEWTLSKFWSITFGINASCSHTIINGSGKIALHVHMADLDNVRNELW